MKRIIKVEETSMGTPEPQSPEDLSRQLSLSADGTALLVQDQGSRAAIYRVSDRSLVASDSRSGVWAISPDGSKVASGGARPVSRNSHLRPEMRSGCGREAPRRYLGGGTFPI